MKLIAFAVIMAVVSAADAAPPLQPTNCSASPASTGAIMATWSNSGTDHDSVIVEYRRSTRKPWSWIALQPEATSITIGGLKPKAWYHMRVKATNASGSSAFSNTSTVRAPR